MKVTSPSWPLMVYPKIDQQAVEAGLAHWSLVDRTSDGKYIWRRTDGVSSVVPIGSGSGLQGQFGQLESVDRNHPLGSCGTPVPDLETMRESVVLRESQGASEAAAPISADLLKEVEVLGFIMSDERYYYFLNENVGDYKIAVHYGGGSWGYTVWYHGNCVAGKILSWWTCLKAASEGFNVADRLASADYEDLAARNILRGQRTGG